MAAVRITCTTCHTAENVSGEGTVLMKASLQLCTSCHDAAAVTQLEAYHAQLKESLGQLRPEVERLQGTLAGAGLAADRQTALTAKLRDVEHDLNLLQSGNDIHNSHYASTLAEAMVAQLTAVSQELQTDAPAVTLPVKPAPPETTTDSGQVPPAAGATPGEAPAATPPSDVPPRNLPRPKSHRPNRLRRTPRRRTSPPPNRPRRSPCRRRFPNQPCLLTTRPRLPLARCPLPIRRPANQVPRTSLQPTCLQRIRPPRTPRLLPRQPCPPLPLEATDGLLHEATVPA